MEKSLEKIIEKDLDFNRIELFTADGEEKKNLCIDNLNWSICMIADDEGRIKNTFQINENEFNRFIYLTASRNQLYSIRRKFIDREKFYMVKFKFYFIFYVK